MVAARKRADSAFERNVELVVRECQSGKAIVGYTDEEVRRKEAFHRAAREVCKVLGRELGCKRPDVHTNMGGPAVAGETYLHTGEMKVVISSFWFYGHGFSGRPLVDGGAPGSPHAWLLFRRTRGDGDWSGGSNAWLAVELLRDLPAAARTIQKAAPPLDAPIAGNVSFVTENAHD